MKKILSLAIACCAFISVSFAQSASFEETYARLIDSINTTPSATQSGAIASSGSMNTSLTITDTYSSGYWSANITIAYSVISSESKKWPNIEMKLNIDSKFNGSLEDQTINNMKIQAQGDIILTPTMAYMRLESLSIDTSKLPLELQGYGDMMMGYAKTHLMNKWIKTRLPKEMWINAQTPTKVTIDTIIQIIKKYPIVKNIGYANNAFAVRFDSNNIAKVMNEITKAQWSSATVSRKEMKEMNDAFNKATVKWTLTDEANPKLFVNLTSQEIGSRTNMDLALSSSGVALSGNMQEDDLTTNVSFSISQTSPYTQTYGINLGMNDTEWFSMNMLINGYQSLGIIPDYTFKAPKKAMSMKQIEKQMSKAMENSLE